jgi:hypothetical protein
LVSSAGALLLRQVLRLSGARRALSVVLAPWRGRRAIHDPGKIVCDVAAADTAVGRVVPWFLVVGGRWFLLSGHGFG